jgi:thioredoxin-related protein
MRFGLLPGVALLLLSFVASGSDVSGMIYVEDLRQESRIASENGLVLLIEFSSPSCTYCLELEKEFLLPMQRNAGYGKRVLIRSVSLDTYQTIIDFDGRSIPTSRLASRYDVMVTPTMVFLDADGNEISDKLVGIWSKDYFGGFIDDRIAEARSNL